MHVEASRFPVARDETAASRATATDRAIPWYLWCAALAVTSAYVGGYWDISWHRSIGRDSFWTAPHLAIYACGVLAGLSSAYLLLWSTFAPAADLREASVRIWGLSGPLGAFVSAWGGVAMLVSAPFDDWWHNAYGLDVRIISPPHMVLAAGFFGIELGTVMLLLAFMNRAAAHDAPRTDSYSHPAPSTSVHPAPRTSAHPAPRTSHPALQRLFLYVSGTVVCESLLLKLEYIARSDMHNALFYIVVSLGTPALLAALAVASGHRWASTIMAAVYTAFGVAFLWILPLFPAEPKLGPVYRPVTHFIPWEFPLLLIVPAMVLDVILRQTGGWRPLSRGVAAGIAFLATFIAVQWPFANFLMTPAARNAFFGTGYLDFSTPARSAYARYVFVVREPSAVQFWRGMLIAFGISCLMMWIGVHAGRAMRKVRR